MEQINNLVLRDPLIFPDDKILHEVLESTYSYYEKLLNIFSSLELCPEWRYYNDGKAWLCKVTHKKRTIVWMSAWNGYMKATVYFPEKYTPGIFDLDIRESSKLMIQNCKNVGKSKPCTFEITDDETIADLLTIIHYKLRSK